MNHYYKQEGKENNNNNYHNIKNNNKILFFPHSNFKRVIIRQGNPHELLRVFRISVLNFSDMDHLDQLIAFKAISIDNEVKAMRNALYALKKIIQGYPSLDSELALLERNDLNSKQKLAIRLRMGEKEILENTIEDIQTMWKNILINGELFGGAKI